MNFRDWRTFRNINVLTISAEALSETVVDWHSKACLLK